MRQAIGERLEFDQERFEDEIEGDFQEYCEGIKDSQPGTLLEVQVAADMFFTRIFVYEGPVSKSYRKMIIKPNNMTLYLTPKNVSNMRTVFLWHRLKENDSWTPLGFKKSEIQKLMKMNTAVAK